MCPKREEKGGGGREEGRMGREESGREREKQGKRIRDKSEGEKREGSRLE